MPRKKRGFCDWFNLIAAIWIVISDMFQNAYCLRDLKIFVPDAVIANSAATLSCQYDLEQASLYSVRWYFEAEEFYRYVPKESPPMRVFPVAGISVDLSRSDSTSVTLRRVTRELTGQFHCEVSEDAPYFHTAIRLGFMQVVELPKEDPMLQIDKKIIGRTDSVKFACTVGRSYPAANITWFINGRKIYKTPFQRIIYRTYESSATFSSLELYPHSQILLDIFHDLGKFQATLNVLCEVSILHVYHKSVQSHVLVSKTLAGGGSGGTQSPNLLGLDGSKRSRGATGGSSDANGIEPDGDPDNSPLTGNAYRNGETIIWQKVFIILLFLFYNSVFNCL